MLYCQKQIQEVHNMKKIGMMVAVEIQSVLDKYDTRLTETELAGCKIYQCKDENYELIIVHSGAGEIRAAAATQLLISHFHVDMIVNFGVVGGLTEAMNTARICIVEKVVHYDFDSSAADGSEVGRYQEYPDIYIPADPELLQKARTLHPELIPVICASADKFVASPDRKRELNRLFNADICEMEAAGILLTCNRNQIPCLMLKIVSDSINGGAEEFWERVDETAALCLELVDEIIGEL